MPDCPPFRLYIGDQLPQLLPIIFEQMRQRGAQVSGGDAGTFTISLSLGMSLRGRYEISGKSLLIQLDARPFALSCGAIESKLQDFLLDAKAILKSRS